jgi:hypothetical protein
MRHQLLDVVVLARDLPEHGLASGDLGTVVEVYERGEIEVEFATVSGQAQAIVTLNQSDVRVAAGDDVPSVRPRQRA